MGWSEREAHCATEICHLSGFERSFSHPGLEPPWEPSLSCPQPPDCKSFRVLFTFCSYRESLHLYVKILSENLYPKSWSGRISKSQCVIFRMFFGPIGNEMKRHTSGDSSLRFQPPHSCHPSESVHTLVRKKNQSQGAQWQQFCMAHRVIRYKGVDERQMG